MTLSPSALCLAIAAVAGLATGKHIDKIWYLVRFTCVGVVHAADGLFVFFIWVILQSTFTVYQRIESSALHTIMHSTNKVKAKDIGMQIALYCSVNVVNVICFTNLWMVTKNTSAPHGGTINSDEMNMDLPVSVTATGIASKTSAYNFMWHGFYCYMAVTDEDL